jgi:TRAP transporter 4TM/12TM fusion protein
VTSAELVYRAARPELLDIVFGVAAIVFVLEATRRTTGWALPAICLAFLLYAFFGGLLPEWTQIAHKGYGIDRIVGQSYMGLDGIFGVPLDVAATYIVLFSIYGAVLEFSGAARFFVEISFAAFGRSRTGPGRTTAGAGFLLGTVSGSGVATTVTLGSVTWPLLRKAGYPKEQGGGIMAASGIGAILSPPTLGAAAFIIAEVLEVSYLQVLIYALIPSILYYVGIVMAIEADARRHHVKGLEIETPGVGKLLARWGYHFSSLFLIVILLVVGFSAFRAVIIATVVAFLLSFLDRRDWMGPRQVGEALVAGARGALPVVATCAAAGLIVAVVSLTGLGLKIAGLIVDLAGGSLTFTAILSAVAVLILGLAVPVTASFIIAAAVVAPALIALGVEDFAAYMFIFYYAVLSEVSPPTALSAFAASAITGGNGFKTMMLTCRYTLPAFLVPFAFILSPRGEGLLLQGGRPRARGLAEGRDLGPGAASDRRRGAAAAVAGADRRRDRAGRARRRPGAPRAHAQAAARRGLSRTAPASAAITAAPAPTCTSAATPTAVPTCAAVLSRPETAPRSASATAEVPSVVAATDAAPSP